MMTVASYDYYCDHGYNNCDDHGDNDCLADDGDRDYDATYHVIWILNISIGSQHFIDK